METAHPQDFAILSCALLKDAAAKNVGRSLTANQQDRMLMTQLKRLDSAHTSRCVGTRLSQMFRPAPRPRERRSTSGSVAPPPRGMAYSKRKTCLTFGGQLVNCPKKDLHCAATFLRSYDSPTDLSSSRAQVMLVLCPGIAEVDMVTVLRTDSGLSSFIGCGACSALPACAHVRISRAWPSWVRAG